MSVELTDRIRHLQATLATLEVTLEAIAEAVVWVNAQQQITWCNTAFAHLVGQEPVDLVGLAIATVLPLTRQGRAIAPSDYPDARLRAGDDVPTDYELALPNLPRYLHIGGHLAVAETGHTCVLVIRDVTQTHQLERERQRQQTALRRAEAKFRSIFENATQGIFQTTPDGRCIAANPALARIFGFDTAAALMRDSKKLEHEIYVEPNRRQEFLNWLHQYGVVTNLESQVYRVDGTVIWISENARVVRDEQGNPLYYEGFVEDITERKRAEQQREEYLSMLQATIESTADGILVVTHDRNTPIYNRKFLQIWGVPEALLQPGMADQRLAFLSAQTKDPEGFVNRIWDLFFNHPDAETLDILEMRDGRIFERYSKPQVIGDRIVGRVWSFRDITGRKRAEEALERQATAIRASIDGIGILDETQHFIYLNESHVRIYGYERAEELVGQHWHCLYDETEQRRFEQDIMPQFLATGNWRGEATGRRRDGSTFPQEVALWSLEGGGLVCLVRDITDRRQAELERQQAEAALRRSELKYRNLFENSQVGIFRTRLEDGLILDANQRYAELAGYDSAEELIGKHTSTEFYVDLSDRQRMVAELQRNGEVRNVEMRFQPKNGTPRWGLYSVRLNDEEHCLEGVIADITARKQAEAAMRHSELKYRNLFENSQVGIFRSRVEDGLVVQANQRMVELLGYDTAEAVVGRLSSRDVYENPNERLNILHDLLQHGQLDNYESRLRRKDGSTFWALCSARLNPVDQCLEGVITDISDRKRAEQALQQSELKFRAIVENANDVIYVHDHTGLLQYVSPNVANFLGFDASELEGHPYHRLIHPDDLPTVMPVLQQALEADKGFIQGMEVRVQHKDQSYRWFSLNESVIRNATGDKLVMGIGRDITQRKQVEDALRESEAKFRALFQSDGSAVVLADETGVFDCNNAALELLGYTREQFIGLRVPQFSAPVQPNGQRSEVLSKEMLAIALEHGSHQFEWVHRRADGSDFPAEISLTAVTLGDRLLIQAVIHDLTDRKQAEAALAERVMLSGFRADIGSALTQSDSLSLMLNRCVKATVKHLGVAFARIWILNPHDNVLELQASAGLYTHLNGAHSRIPVGQFKIGRIAQERRAHYTNDVAHDPSISDPEWVRREGMVAFVGYPLILGDQLLGVMGLFAREPISSTTFEAVSFAAREIALGIKRKRAEAALAESEERFRQLAENIDSVFWLTTPDKQQMLYVSKAYETIWGRSREQLYEDPTLWIEAVHPDDRDRVRLALPRQIEGDYDEEYRIIRPDGEIRWIRDRAFPIRDEQGQVYRIAGIEDDISERKRAEDALLASEAQYRDLVQTANCIILRWDTQGNIRFLNDFGLDFFGFTRDELIGHNVVGTIVFPTESSGRDLQSLMEDICEHPETYLFNENENVRKNGDRTWIVWSNKPILDDQGNVVEILSVGTDSTKRKEAEAALESSLSLLNATFESITDGVMATDCCGYVTSYNQKFLDMWGIPYDYLADPSQRLAHIAAQLKEPEGFIQRVWELYATPEGETNDIQELRDGRIYERCSRPQYIGDEIVGRVWIFRDVTASKQAEAALRRSEQKYRTIFENSLVGIGRTRLSDGLFLDANQRCAEIFGVESPEVLIGQRSAVDFYADPDDRQRLMAEIEQHGEIRNFEIYIRRADGQLRWGLLSFCLESEVGCIDFVLADISDRKETEEALRHSELKYRNIFENSQVGIGRTRISDGVILEINQRCAQIMGFNAASEVLGRYSTLDFYANADDRRHVLRCLQRQGAVQNYELPMRRHDGSILWGLLSVRYSGDGETLDFVFEDISDRKRLEEELRQSQKFLDSIINNIPLAIFVKDIGNDYRYVKLNQYAAPILGIDPQQAVGHNDHDLLPPEQADYHRREDLRVVLKGDAIESEEWLSRPSTSPVLVHGWKILLHDSANHPKYLLGISEDITDRWHREQALRLIVEGTAGKTGSEFFRSCVRYLAEVLQVHFSFVTEFTDEAHTQVRTLATWGTLFSEGLVYGLDDAPCCAQVLRGEMCYVPEGLNDRFPADSPVVEAGLESYLGMPLTNAEGTVLGHIAVLDNKPMQPHAQRELILRIFAARAGAELERQQAEEALRIAKEAAESANRAKSAFLANMSHELRTPLNSILGFAQLMERDPALTERQRSSLATINRSGEHLLDLINDVLEMSKIEAGRIMLNLAPFNLHDLLHTLHEMFLVRAEAKRLTLRFQIAPDLPHCVVADEGKLRQVLINLLSNAIKFTDMGSTTLRVREAPITTEEALLRAVETFDTPGAELRMLVFEIEDTGRGIALQEREKLFQPFMQTLSGSQVREGTGLGLAISRQFVRLMGGDIEVSSTVGQGSTFRFTVQVQLVDPTEMMATSARGRVSQIAPHQPGYRILVVDDRVENRDLIVQLLSSVGFEIRTANHGREAIALWQHWHPDLIWMDMRMPVMDGYEATRRIRAAEAAQLGASQRPTVIIALTASAFEEQRTNILAAGCNDLVRKPFRESLIFEKMAEHLGVEYIYEKAEQGRSPEHSFIQTEPFAAMANQTTRLLPSDLRVMPPEWIAQLQQAAIAVDADSILQRIAEIPHNHRILIEELTRLVNQFDFDGILDLTDGT